MAKYVNRDHSADKSKQSTSVKLQDDLEMFLLRRLTVFTIIKGYEIGRAGIIQRIDEKNIHNFRQQTWMEDIIWEYYT